MQQKRPSLPAEQFSIVRALCRTALASPNEAITQQVRRLVDSYRDSGLANEAEALAKLLDQAEPSAAFAPSRLVRSRASLGGEELTPKTMLPVDRETASKLVDVIFPGTSPVKPPIFDPDVAEGVQSLITEWMHWDSLKALSVVPTHSCLIYGAPGTGKTQLALWMAEQLDLPVVLARLDGLVSSFLGTTSRNIGSLFQFANRYRCVLLLDEFDAIAKVRDDPQEVGEIKRVVNTLLQNLDGRREVGITIGVTNHEQLLDAAVWRRFDVQLAVPRPEFKTRLEIARQYLAGLPLGEVQHRLIAWISEGLTGAEIEAIARSVRKSAAIEADDFDFLTTLRRLATLQSGRVRGTRRETLRHEGPQLAALLLDDTTLALGQRDLAALFERDPATISRWLKERNLHPA